MATEKQLLGQGGEQLVAIHARCPGCKPAARTFKILPTNFKCADLICDFCGYLAQVKTKRIEGALPHRCPESVPGAAWGPQRDRMEAGVFFSLYVVLVNKQNRAAIYFLPRDLQTREMFAERKPLSATARRAGWQGFTIRMDRALSPAVRLSDGDVHDFRFQPMSGQQSKK
ncbi:DpnI domain-containing protein [Mycobacteroides abscessus]|uniref:DpnI domain-containing protein n=1 Tax=Mycobacteroides abscessus TaxID=36809 RepID=UPI0002FB0741|nr:DpnI domain-containing protein [Mycobacteroides abscessus]AMU29992.1 hypothetical protein A3N97_04820 [Mycobacteroides abscessus]AMU74253.1 hypothetical protein A3O06_05960 [Mycobacteroides abscessus]ANN98090.1 hypothetical protein BAB74_04525 [Mycobacteroides abscessus]ANO23190.1 hypothetical protein BAB79_05955 [Mycobacteroides abscessus]MBN7303171.1 hypothetical protein [Mycobacteroides abscessus subsp. bolletii]